jgi:hypothetical protein
LRQRPPRDAQHTVMGAFESKEDDVHGHPSVATLPQSTRHAAALAPKAPRSEAPLVRETHQES